jgi:hypothetical protein
VVEQERELALRAAEPGRGQRLDALADGRAGHGRRVERVRLGELARALARPGHRLGGHAHAALARAQREALEPARDLAAVLDRPDPGVGETPGPAEQARVARLAGARGQLVERLSGLRPARHRGVAPLVWVRPDHDHVPVPAFG